MLPTKPAKNSLWRSRTFSAAVIGNNTLYLKRCACCGCNIGGQWNVEPRQPEFCYGCLVKQLDTQALVHDDASMAPQNVGLYWAINLNAAIDYKADWERHVKQLYQIKEILGG